MENETSSSESEEEISSHEEEEIIYTPIYSFDVYPQPQYTEFINILEQIDNAFINFVEYYSFENSNNLDRNENNMIQYHIVNIDKDILCTICTENIIETSAKLSCNHYFHENCIVEWGKYKQVCPMCRNSIIKENEVPKEGPTEGIGEGTNEGTNEEVPEEESIEIDL